MAYETSDALRTALETRLLNEARARGVSVDRLRRLAVFERILVRLEAAQPGNWVLKGGLALEVRLGGYARATRDLDLSLRAPVGDGEALFAAIVEPLGGDPDEDGFRFMMARPTALTGDQAGRPAWRFTIEASMAGRQFATFGSTSSPGRKSWPRRNGCSSQACWLSLGSRPVRSRWLRRSSTSPRSCTR